MVHPYKKYDEHRHGRAVAKERGYQSGGVVKHPSSDNFMLNNLRSRQGIDSGRIPGASKGNVAHGPGINRETGGVKRSFERRFNERDAEWEGGLPRAKGGKVKRQMGGGIAKIAMRKMRESASDEKLQEYRGRIEPIRPSASAEVDQIVSRQQEMDRQSRAPYKSGGKIPGKASIKRKR